MCLHVFGSHVFLFKGLSGQMNTNNQLLNGDRSFWGDVSETDCCDLRPENRMRSNQHLVSTCEGPVPVLEAGYKKTGYKIPAQDNTTPASWKRLLPSIADCESSGGDNAVLGGVVGGGQ